MSSQQFAVADVSSGDRPVLVPIEPCRISDTRPGDNQVGPRGFALGAAETMRIDAQESGTLCSGQIPADALALSLNVTALNATELSFLTVWAGGDRPLAASLNPAPGQPPVPNAVTTQLSVDQEFEVYNNAGTVNIVIDVNGYYTNHNHDDAYAKLGHDHDGDYTTPSDLEARRDSIDSFSVDLAARSAWGTGGIGVAKGASIPIDFVVPSDFSLGAELTIDISWTIYVLDFPGCTVGFEVDPLTQVFRESESPPDPPATFEPDIAPTTTERYVTSGSLGGLEPGDAVSLYLGVTEPPSSCGGPSLTGIRFEYPTA